MPSEREDRDYYLAQLPDSGCFHLGQEFPTHLRSVLDQLPFSVLEKLVKSNLVFFAPDHQLGEVFTANISVDVGQIVVYLSPELLARPRNEIEGVIAHELAHVVLDHTTPCCGATVDLALSDERAADELAESWGFLIPADRKIGN